MEGGLKSQNVNWEGDHILVFLESEQAARRVSAESAPTWLGCSRPKNWKVDDIPAHDGARCAPRLARFVLPFEQDDVEGGVLFCVAFPITSASQLPVARQVLVDRLEGRMGLDKAVPIDSDGIGMGVKYSISGKFEDPSFHTSDMSIETLRGEVMQLLRPHADTPATVEMTQFHFVPGSSLKVHDERTFTITVEVELNQFLHAHHKDIQEYNEMNRDPPLRLNLCGVNK